LDLETLGEFVGPGLITAAVLLVVAVVLLPREERKRVRLPLVLLVLHLLLLAVDYVVPDRVESGKKVVSIAALLFLLLSIGRTSFLLLVHSVLSRKLANPLPKIFRDILQAAIYGVAALITLQAVGVEPTSLLTTSALVTAVIGLSLQDTLGNLFAGLAIQAQRPFDVGDWIQYDDKPENVGVVTEINWRAVRVLTVDNVEITVPNNMLARAPIRNYTRPQGDSRRRIACFAPYEIPPQRVTTLLLDAIKDVPGVLQTPPPDVLVVEFDERGVKYSVRYFITDFERREPIDARVRERVWYTLHRATIAIPVPQRVLHVHEASQADSEARQQRGIDERVRYLRAVDFLGGVPDESVLTLAKMSETRIYATGEAIIRQGDTDEEFFIVERGRVAVELAGSNSTQRLAELGPGQFFGEMSLMTGERRRATVRALDECRLLVVGKQAFHKMFDDRPELIARISETLALREAEIGEVKARESLTPKESERSAELLGRIRDFFSL
jgi:small-conductance mechanosensitive channel/CRP-like cAMP-binding protein